MDKIEWKKLNENYLLSNDGRVFSIKKQKELVPWTTKKGYLKIDMGRNCREYIHRLVAREFLPNPDNKPTVNHINHNKKDNRIENLEWATYREQTEHDVKTGKREIVKGKDGRFQKKEKRIGN